MPTGTHGLCSFVSRWLELLSFDPRPAQRRIPEERNSDGAIVLAVFACNLLILGPYLEASATARPLLPHLLQVTVQAFKNVAGNKPTHCVSGMVVGVKPSFLQRYFQAFRSIEGWFQYDAALMFMAYNQLVNHQGTTGHVMEIGVHHGLSAIAVAALRGPNRSFCAVDLFERLQSANVSASGDGSRVLFEKNMEAFYPGETFIRVFAQASASLDAAEAGSDFSFCHIDGGHTRQETYNDLCLCHEILLPGGLVALDDYFNVEFPGVCEGAVEFMLKHPDALRPIAIGYGKTLFQKPPARSDLNADFERMFPLVEHKYVPLWGKPTLLFTSVFRDYFDLYASTPHHFVPFGSITRAMLRPATPAIRAAPEETISLPVAIENTSQESFPAGEKVFGLSYHLLTKSGAVLQHDNDRTWLSKSIQPGETQTVALSLKAPSRAGQYRLEIDLVWEQIMWFKDVGNPTALVEFQVE